LLHADDKLVEPDFLLLGGNVNGILFGIVGYLDISVDELGGLDRIPTDPLNSCERFL